MKIGFLYRLSWAGIDTYTCWSLKLPEMEMGDNRDHENGERCERRIYPRRWGRFLLGCFLSLHQSIKLFDFLL